MSSLLTPLSWTERAKVFQHRAKVAAEAGDRHAHEAALLSVQTCRMMAVEEGEISAEEAEALYARDQMATVEGDRDA